MAKKKKKVVKKAKPIMVLNRAGHLVPATPKIKGGGVEALDAAMLKRLRAKKR